MKSSETMKSRQLSRDFQITPKPVQEQSSQPGVSFKAISAMT